MTRNGSKIVKFFLTNEFSPVVTKDVQLWLLENDFSDTEEDEGSLEFWNGIEPVRGESRDKDIKRIWGKITRRLKPRPGESSLESPKTKTIPLFRGVLFRVAAVLIPAALIIGAFVFYHPVDQTPAAPVYMADITVHEGMSEEYELPDGSCVVIEGGSTLRYYERQSAGELLCIAELSGKARFDVAPNKEKPFTVDTEYLSVTVLGTDFDVDAYHACEKAAVLLHEGEVDVSVNGEIYHLTPGNKLEYDTLTCEVMINDIQPAEEPIPYSEGMTLAEIFAMIERVYQITVETPRTVLSDHEQYSVDFNPGDDLELVMSVLQDLVDGMRYETTDDKIVVKIKR